MAGKTRKTAAKGAVKSAAKRGAKKPAAVTSRKAAKPGPLLGRA